MPHASGYPALPPSRFGAGHTVGAPLPSPAGAGAPLPSATGAPGTNRLALVSLALVLLFGFVVAPVTIPMAAVARRQIARSGQPGAGVAKAALLVGAAYLAIGAVVLGLRIYLWNAAPSGAA